MVKIRLLRMGRHKAPTYRIVVADSKAKANGAYIELLGQYDPLKNTKSLKLEAILKWLENGAQPTETVKSFLKQEKLWADFMNKKQAVKAEKLNAKKASK